MRSGLALMLAVLWAPPAARAQLVNENLLTSAPAGYKIGFHEKKNDLDMTEWVPSNETVQSWSEMLTVQIFYGRKVAPEQVMHDLEPRWRKACPGAGDAQPVAAGVEGGYPAMVWILDCAQNPATHKPELTWFKAIEGNDSFYIVQKAFKFTPNNVQVARWVKYLKGVRVCDSRLADRACPQVKEPRAKEAPAAVAPTKDPPAKQPPAKN
jgi:hypothetical protein